MALPRLHGCHAQGFLRLRALRVQGPRERVERPRHVVHARRGAKNSALHVHHLDGRRVVRGICCCRPVLQQQTLVPEVVRLPHCGVHAHIRGDAAEDEALDAARPEHQVHVRVGEGALAGLVDDVLAGQGGELGDKIPPGLAAREDPAAGARVANADAPTGLPAAPALIGGKVGERRAVALARVNDADPRGACSSEHLLERLDWGARHRHVVPHLRHVPPEPAKVRLHVDQHQRHVVGGERSVEGPRVWRRRRHLRAGDIGRCAHFLLL
mmetsp:Transcript_22375/g.55281  ORF Transcript_22375/g.55281 Transcript_22375/m.55281 type:complete len:269 (-) Transcript_22375:382-1188(-)